MKANAATVAKILGGKPEGVGYLCPCPVKGHGKGRGDLRPSLSVSDGRRSLVFHCFAGCAPLDILAALNALATDAAAISTFTNSPTPPLAKRPKTTSEHARRLWRSAVDVAGTPAETYLSTRFLPAKPPPTVRFLPSYRYRPSDSSTAYPCLIAAIQAPTREIIAVQLTFLHPSGRRKADVLYPRRAIGPLGDGMLRLAPAAAHLGIAEGFETAWAASLLHDGAPVWATLGNDRFAVITLPPIVKQLTIYADNDGPGLRAARAYKDTHPQLETRIVKPLAEGDDFARVNELLQGDFHEAKPLIGAD